MHCIRLNWGLVRFGKWGRERIQKSYVDMQLMINIQLTWKHREILSKCLVTFLLVLQLHQLHHVAIICPVGTMSHPYLYFQKYFAWQHAFSKFIELNWLFRSLGEMIWVSCISLVSCPFYCTFSLCFCLYQVFPIGCLNSQAPSIMASRGGGRGCGRGQLTFNVEAVGIGKGDALPPPTLQPSPLFPVSVCPPFPRSFMPLTDCMWSWIPPGSSKSSSSGPSLSLYLQLTWDIFQTRKCLPLLFIVSAPQLSKCCVAPSICLWFPAQWEHWVEVWGEERPS